MFLEDNMSSLLNLISSHFQLKLIPNVVSAKFGLKMSATKYYNYDFAECSDFGSEKK